MFNLTAYQTTILLPNPEFSDGEGSTDEVSRIRSTNGTLRTYVKKKGRRKLQWSFSLSRNKAIELEFFIKSYVDFKIKVVDHNDRTWIGNIMSNPVEINTVARAMPALQDWPVGERCSVTLDFEGVEQ